MKPNPSIHKTQLRAILHACGMLILMPTATHASIAYGSINNFDTVNDTGSECHGFEIEIEDCRSTDITYTYDYNHYGTPTITQDDSLPLHPKCLIRWASSKQPDGSWASYTAIPSGTISATDGHQFTNPNINFGGEHFGVGYSVAVGAIRYHWLIDNGSGTLIHGGAVQVSTPSFTYFPPVAGFPAQVQAVIEPPEAPEIPELEFGKAVWVKEIRTTTHNNNKVELRDLVSEDPDEPENINWRNGEPDEVEVEWQILQKELSKPNGGNNGRLVAAPEDLDDGDEVVTRRYEFYEYLGPIDENGEAKATKVGGDGIHGEGIKMIDGVEVDLANLIVVGDYKGAQMAAVDVEGKIGLIDHVSEGEINVPYTDRRLVVEGPLPFTASLEGELPNGMEFDLLTGILSGTPDQSGGFSFNIMVDDGTHPVLAKNYLLRIAQAGAEPPPGCLIDTVASPADAGTTSGDGSYPPNTEATVQATPSPGYRFVNWTDNGEIVGTSSNHTFQLGDVNRSLVANFEIAETPTHFEIRQSPSPGVLFALEWSLVPEGWILEESPDLAPGSWTPSNHMDNPHDGLHHLEISDPTPGNRFYRLRKP